MISVIDTRSRHMQILSSLNPVGISRLVVGGSEGLLGIIGPHGHVVTNT